VKRETGNEKRRVVPPSVSFVFRFSFFVFRLLLLACPVLAAAAAPPEPIKVITISPELKVSIAEGEEVFLSARPLPGEGVDAFLKRFTDDPGTKKEILDQNQGFKLFRPDVFVRVPYRFLSDNYRKIAMEALFPEDHADPKGWTHVVAAPTGHPESLWRIAEWFTGDGANYREIRSEGKIVSLETEAGQTVQIPARLLLVSFRHQAAAEPEPPPLEYGRDEKGRYAIYRLKRGEALYSSVVVRFTGRVHAEDVNAKATEIAARNGIGDVRQIPAGFAVRIPVDDLSPEFRPRDDPARIEEEKARLEASQFVNRVRASDLSGVTFVLDAGHGGRDTGALVDGVEEAQAVYDLACRVDALIARHSKARVVLTVRGTHPCSHAPGASDWRNARVMTTPPYGLEDSVTGVNLRWYLANSVLRRAARNGGSAERTVFLSLHADSLHPAVRGAMVYIPGEKFLKGTFGKSGPIYASRREFREEPRVSFSRKERIEAEGISRDFAEKIVAAFRAADLPLHAFAPIRSNVIRGGRAWVPAILRYNRIPARVLVEVCNLNNPEDRKLLSTGGFRDRVARALVSALVDFYGGKGSETVTAQLGKGPAASDR
jgi:N-acetylmuramoyl-L-alanine amidase